MFQKDGDKGRIANRLGFKSKSGGVHTSRTMMLSELQELLLHCHEDSNQQNYIDAIVEDNVLGKQTITTRRETANRLKTLYSLDPNVILFRTLRQLWYGESESQPMLAFLCAMARDPVLRITADTILNLPNGQLADKQSVSSTVKEATGDRFTENTLNTVVRNTLSSWSQAGFFEGARNKVRISPTVTPSVLSYALVVGYVCGKRGRMLFKTLWCKLLDVREDILFELAREASRLGIINFKHGGNVVEVQFPQFFSEEERRIINEQDTAAL